MKKEIDVKLPSLPSFIFVGSDSKPYSLNSFTEEELREIAREWGEALIQKAFPHEKYNR